LKRDINQAKKCAIYANGTFQEGLPIKVEVRALIYVPNKILTALVHIDHDTIKTDNDFAHITLMVGEWKPVQSNDILKALFNAKYGLKKDMTQSLLGPKEHVPKGHAEKVCVNIFKGESEAYITTPADGPIEI
jgi:hypothetical protein